MGGKGRRRREKNYRAAHGGYSTLPPPPDPSQVDALPSKLRRIIAFNSSPQYQSPGTAAFTKNIDKRKKRAEGHVRNELERLACTIKAFKNAQDASQERLRLKAIEAYRYRKGWTSRPGSHLLPPLTTSTS